MSPTPSIASSMTMGPDGSTTNPASDNTRSTRLLCLQHELLVVQQLHRLYDESLRNMTRQGGSLMMSQVDSLVKARQSAQSEAESFVTQYNTMAAQASKQDPPTISTANDSLDLHLESVGPLELDVALLVRELIEEQQKLLGSKHERLVKAKLVNDLQVDSQRRTK